MQDRIKALRKSLGLTQKDFGERIGVQANTITSYESGVRTPNNSMILAICREYGVSEDWLRTGEGEMKQKLTRNQEIAEFMSSTALSLLTSTRVWICCLETSCLVLESLLRLYFCISL